MTPTSEIKAERETPSGDSPSEFSVEFELEWEEDEEGETGDDSGLSIE